MAKRITIMVEDEIDSKLRIMQANLIKTEMKSISYSKVLGMVLKKGLK